MRGRGCRAGAHTRAVDGDLLVRARHRQAGVERAAARLVQRDALDVLERERRRLVRGDVHAVEAEVLGIDAADAALAGDVDVVEGDALDWPFGQADDVDRLVRAGRG